MLDINFVLGLISTLQFFRAVYGNQKLLQNFLYNSVEIALLLDFYIFILLGLNTRKCWFTVAIIRIQIWLNFWTKDRN